MTDPILETRLANALFGGAALSRDAAAALASAGGGGVRATLDHYAARHGGLWVGGRATLTATTLSFAANALNRMVHDQGDALHFDLPLAAIEGVTTRFGWVTGIIDIAAGGTRFSLRCFRSRAFAAAILAARAATS